MASTSSSSSSGGIGFCGLLAIVFITLKLLGKIDWTWTWVLSPIWIPMAILGVCLIGMLVGYIMIRVGENRQKKGKTT